MKAEIARSTILIPLICMFGCQKNYVVKEYVPPTSSQGASVQVTTDPYRNYDQIDIGLVSRDSCDNKYNLEHISHLESGPLWGEDIREADFYLPAGKTINLRIMNSTDYGFYKKHCSNTKTYILKESSNYVLKIKNWSSLEEPELFESSFGCKFDLTRSDGSVLDEAVTDLPKCED